MASIISLKIINEPDPIVFDICNDIRSKSIGMVSSINALMDSQYMTSFTYCFNDWDDIRILSIDRKLNHELTRYVDFINRFTKKYLSLMRPITLIATPQQKVLNDLTKFITENVDLNVFNYIPQNVEHFVRLYVATKSSMFLTALPRRTEIDFFTKEMFSNIDKWHEELYRSVLNDDLPERDTHEYWELGN